MKNEYIAAQILNMQSILRVFEQSCVEAAKRNDGTIDKQEAKQLAVIHKVTARYLQDLEKLK